MLGFIMLLLSCILKKSFWNFFVLLPLMFAPIPQIFFGSRDQYSVDSTGWSDFADFITGFLFMSSWAMILAFYHQHIIPALSMGLGLGAMVFFTASGAYYSKYASQDDSF